MQLDQAVYSFSKLKLEMKDFTIDAIDAIVCCRRVQDDNKNQEIIVSYSWPHSRSDSIGLSWSITVTVFYLETQTLNEV